MQILQPSPDRCQACAEKHDPGEPHNAQTFHYRWLFSSENGRSPTWADAMAHCAEKVQQKWMTYLTNIGVDVYSTNLTGSLKSKKDLEKRLQK